MRSPAAGATGRSTRRRRSIRLAVCIHAGSTFRTAPTYSGWPSYHVEDYVANGAAFENMLVSFIAEGVFQQFPGLKLVCAESGVTWLPTLLWRTNKEWRGVRAEVPWIDRAPAEIVRDHVRFTLQPFDLPAGDTGQAAAHTGTYRLGFGFAVMRPTIRTGILTAKTACRTACRTI